MAASLTDVVARHEALRTVFPASNGQPRAVVNPPSPAVLTVEEVSEADALRCAVTLAALPFDLARGPLLHAALLRFAPEEHALLVTLHHLVTDGWSMSILIRELAELYPWAIDALNYIDRRKNGGAPDDCPLP